MQPSALQWYSRRHLSRIGSQHRGTDITEARGQRFQSACFLDTKRRRNYRKVSNKTYVFRGQTYSNKKPKPLARLFACSEKGFVSAGTGYATSCECCCGATLKLSESIWSISLGSPFAALSDFGLRCSWSAEDVHMVRPTRAGAGRTC